MAAQLTEILLAGQRNWPDEPAKGGGHKRKQKKQSEIHSINESAVAARFVFTLKRFIGKIKKSLQFIDDNDG